MRLDLLRAWRGRYTRSWFETLLRIVPAALYIWVIFALSSTEPQDLPGIVIDDRIAHFVEYAILGVVMMLALAAARGLEDRPVARAFTSILIATSIGMLDEWNQSFVPGRDSSWKDVAFDLLGASFSTMVIAIVLRRNAAWRGESVLESETGAP
ncbi:MAG TPA: VanZ family protein [Thermoanaerobaculia bacterium]|nr:VanZ family protein [Thermoanaerobaculia bacterium]